MQATKSYEYVIIGAGQGGALARMLAQAGKSVALIESQFLGGTCVNRGCTPTKSHISCARRAHVMRQSAVFGVHGSEPEVRLGEIQRRSEEIVQEFRQELEDRLEAQKNLDILRGQAHFTGPMSVAISGSSVPVEGETIVLATGTRTRVPNIAGLDAVPWLDSRSILKITVLPEQLLILGGGPIACELAQMFARFGSRVTILQKGPSLLSHEDPELGKALTDIFSEEGISVHLNFSAQAVSRNGNFTEVRSNDLTFSGTHLLLATGQKPNSDELQLQLTGVKCDDQGYVITDDYLQAAPGIYALGDVKGGPAFTHLAFDDARILHNEFLGGARRSWRDRLVPYVIFTDPQIARVGLNQTQAQANGIPYRLAQLPMTQTARGVETGEDAGYLEVLVHPETGLILGATLLAHEAGEVMPLLQVAIMAGLPYQALRDGIFAHPTLAESFNNLFLTLDSVDLDCIKTAIAD